MDFALQIGRDVSKNDRVMMEMDCFGLGEQKCCAVRIPETKN